MTNNNERLLQFWVDELPRSSVFIIFEFVLYRPLSEKMPFMSYIPH